MNSQTGSPAGDTIDPTSDGQYSVVHSPMQGSVNGGPGPQMMQMQWNMSSGIQKVIFPAVIPDVYGQVYTPTSNPSQQYMFTVNNTNDGLESGQVMPQLYGQQVYSNRAPVLNQAQYACTVSNRYNEVEVEGCVRWY